jgi:hypothetical protein
MNTPLPPHLSEAIKQRIAVLREAWRLDEVYPPRPAGHRPTGHPSALRRPDPRPQATSPTFPGPREVDPRTTSAWLPSPHRDGWRSNS